MTEVAHDGINDHWHLDEPWTPDAGHVLPSVSADSEAVTVEIPVPDADGGAQSFLVGALFLVVAFAWFVRGGQSVFGTLGNWAGQALLVVGVALFAVVVHNLRI